MRRTRTGLAVLSLLAGAVLSGCGGGESGGGSGEAESVDASVATYAPMQMAGTMQVLEGSLVVTDGCVYVEDGEGTQWLPVFPEGLASWEGSALVMDGEEYAAGETVAVEGGKSAGAPMMDEQVPEGCDDSNRWIVSGPAG